MASKIKNLGLVLIIIGAILIILSHYLGWNNSNLVNMGSLAMIIAGLITYIIAGKKLLQE
jgi:membrane-bound ClpP family serine protease